MSIADVVVRFTGRTALLSLAAFLSTSAQERPSMEWGEVPVEHLRMTSFPSDTNASAVILFDHGEGTFNSNLDMQFIRHTRIKILKKAGFDRGNVVVTYYAGENTERISKIEGITTTLGANGEPVQTEMDDDAIFKEEVFGDWRRIRFALPALTEGCVIEYRYKRTSEGPWYLPDWDFQTTEPVLWSEYRVVSPPVYQYAILTYGSAPYAIHDVRREQQSFFMGGGSSIQSMQIIHYARNNVPALRIEPYITTLDDYRLKLVVQLAAFRWPGEATRPVFETWPKLMKEMLKNKHISGLLGGTRTIRNLAHALTDHLSAPLHKIAAIYDHLRTTVVWNGRDDYGSERDPDEVLESKKGSCADINLLLIAMLREAGLDATPVLLSTRDHGKIQKLWPIYSNFNYVIARVKSGGDVYLLDATDRQRPMSVLPTRALNHEGLLMEEGPETWVPVQPGLKSREATFVKVALANDGSVRGTMQKSFADYRAFDQRVAIAGTKDEDYVKKLLQTETSGFAADSFSIANRDSCELAFAVDAHISSAAAGQVLDDFIYINPMLFERTMENPFKLATRSFPVDIPYGSQSTYTLELKVPDGYVVKEVPKPFSTGLPADGGSYTRSVEVAGNTVSMLVRLDLTETYIEPHMYQNIRQMFEQIVAREAEQIVLAKYIPPPPPPPPPAVPAKRKK